MKKQRFDFVELLETVAGREFMVPPSNGLRVTYELPDTPLYVEADMDRMEQILHNLIDNAKKFVKAGGGIHITLRPEGNKFYFPFTMTPPLFPMKS